MIACAVYAAIYFALLWCIDRKKESKDGEEEA